MSSSVSTKPSPSSSTPLLHEVSWRSRPPVVGDVAAVVAPVAEAEDLIGAFAGVVRAVAARVVHVDETVAVVVLAVHARGHGGVVAAAGVVAVESRRRRRRRARCCTARRARGRPRPSSSMPVQPGSKASMRAVAVIVDPVRAGRREPDALLGARGDVDGGHVARAEVVHEQRRPVRGQGEAGRGAARQRDALDGAALERPEAFVGERHDEHGPVVGRGDVGDPGQGVHGVARRRLVGLPARAEGRGALVRLVHRLVFLPRDPE